MENLSPTNQIPANLYDYAANLYFGQNKNSYEVRTALLAQGLDEVEADTVIDSLEGQIQQARRAQAKKDMLHGGLWCAGGTILTLAHIGFIFWGAILFGAVQFIKGVSNLNKA
jgi:fructosamine-3-kinase